MANICSISLNLVFSNKKDKKDFKDAFQRKINAAEKRNEGIRIARNKWLFDACINETGARSLAVHGSTRWCLETDAMADFHKYLTRMKATEYTCYYEETGDQIYGKFYFEDGELWNTYVGYDNPVWSKTYAGEDSYFDDLEHALDNSGELEHVA